MAEATHIENGYVLLARRLFDSRLWNCPPDTFRVAIFLLLKARHKSTPHKLPDGSNIHRGELVTSYADISDNCAWYENRRERQYSRQKVNRILTELINIGFCEKKSDSYGTHLSICNYETYQIPENYNSDKRVTTAEQPRDNSVTTPDTNKNDEERGKMQKNDKEGTAPRAREDWQTSDYVEALQSFLPQAPIDQLAYALQYQTDPKLRALAFNDCIADMMGYVNGVENPVKMLRTYMQNADRYSGNQNQSDQDALTIKNWHEKI